MATPKVSQADRIPLGQKIAFAAGVNTDYIATGLMTGVLWMPFFNIGLGINAAVLGGILMLLRAWDAISDPIMGNLSDNARTRWGRRRPFMFVGAIITACCYPLIWYMPVDVGQTAKSLYLIIVGLLFFTSFTLWSMPYYGMQLELTPNYDERTRLTAWMTFFGKLSSLSGAWLLSFVIFIGMLVQNDSRVFEGRSDFTLSVLLRLQGWLGPVDAAHAGDNPIITGMRVVCWGIAAAILVLGLLPALFTRERYYKAETSRQAREPFWQSIRESLRCGPLWSLILVSFFLVLGGSSVATLGQYVNFYYACEGNLIKGAYIAGLKGTVIMVVGIATIPVFTWLGEKLDKRRVVMLMVASSMFGHLLNIALMTPHNPYLQIIPGVFEASALGAIWLFLPSMKADVADWDEMHTSRRREGALNAFYSWFIKASLTLSMGIGGIVLQISSFDPALEVQPHEVTRKMFLVYLVLPVVIWLLALVSMWFYPLTRSRCAEIRTELESRRGSL